MPRTIRFTLSDRGATWAYRVGLLLTLPVLYLVGRHQWFIRDDWAFVFTRGKMHAVLGLDDMLFAAQDGHWMTVPIVVWRTITSLFGTGSYWPYLLTAMATHLGVVALVRKVALRVGVTPWTATALAAVMMVLGYGWENIVFAIQVVYNLSLIGFLLQLILVDHDGPIDRRDYIGAVCGLLAVTSSGFGPFFVAGIATFLATRRRWRALAVGCAPAVVALAWWWSAWGKDPAADAIPPSRARVPAFVNRGFSAVFEALTTLPSLTGVCLVATLAVLLWRRRDPRSHDLVFTLAVTAVLFFFGIGWQRVGLGVETAANSRYTYMGVMMVVPAFGIAVDQLRRLGEPAQWAARLLLLSAALTNLAALHSNAEEWSARSSEERHLLGLLAGSPQLAGLPGGGSPLPFSPDVRIGDIAVLVSDGAIKPVQPANQADADQLAAAINRSLRPAP